MDTDHPRFSEPAPEYADPLKDQILEQIADGCTAAGVPMNAIQLRVSSGVLEKTLPQTETRSGMYDFNRSVLLYLADKASPHVEFQVLLYAFGLLGRGEESMDSIAAPLNLSRQAFSKLVQKAQADFGIAPINGMRPTEQRKVYERVQRARKQRVWTDVSPSMRRPTRLQLKAPPNTP